MRTRSWTRTLGILLVIVLSGTLFSACGGASVEVDDTRSEDERNKQPAPLNSVVLLDAQTFQEKREAGALVLDARSADDYAAGHLEGAINADEKVLFKDSTGAVSSDTPLVQERARSIGLMEEGEVIIYGGKSSSKTGRLFWTLEYLGHGEVYLYLDPYDKLIDELGETPSTEAVTPEEGNFVVARRESINASREEVKQAIDGDLQAILIDTRTAEEYEGTDDRDNPRHGTLPGAIFYEWTQVLDENGNLRPKQELLDEFKTEGFWNEDSLLIPYCQTGTRSGTVYAVLRWLGHPNVQNYDGSWYEWSRDENLPIEEGASANQ